MTATGSRAATRPDRARAGDELEVLQEEIAQTREDLGETIEALTSKLDVRARTKQKAGEVKERATDVVQSKGPTLATVGAAAVAGLIVLMVLRNQNRRRYGFGGLTGHRRGFGKGFGGFGGFGAGHGPGRAVRSPLIGRRRAPGPFSGLQRRSRHMW
jgi:hypothetical protein